MSILDSIFRRQVEARHGKIFTTPGNWVFHPTDAQVERTIARGAAFLHSKDANGAKMYLIHQRGVHCPNDDLCNGEYPKSKEGEYWYLPLHVCKKCEHYRKGKRRGTPRYPCCKYVASPNPTAQALADTLSVFDEAKKFADDIIGNC